MRSFMYGRLIVVVLALLGSNVFGSRSLSATISSSDPVQKDDMIQLELELRAPAQRKPRELGPMLKTSEPELDIANDQYPVQQRSSRIEEYLTSDYLSLQPLGRPDASLASAPDATQV